MDATSAPAKPIVVSSPPATPGPDPKAAAASRVLGAYKQMLVAFFWTTLILVAVLGAFLLPFFYRLSHGDPQTDPPLLIVVILAGSIGALFSALFRLYNFEDLPKALIAKELEGLPTRTLLIYSLVPPVIGAIASAVLYVVFAAGLLQGDLFPKFACKATDNSTCSSFGLLVGSWSPDKAQDYAKALVWAFIAGFAERFVPDTLQGLSRSAQSPANNKNSGGGSVSDQTTNPAGTGAT